MEFSTIQVFYGAGSNFGFGVEATCVLFCNSKETLNLYSAFCLGNLNLHQWEPKFQAFVFENGHVLGKWIEKLMHL
ncbi:hypothetical protein KFK09_012452 [Dendrobium nobile]|uniref:Uncharacterized protein n=1 Tax=Dendrobium nobile TaxID=94219 RepID=A0A8T3BHR9_DENNO|nr:hypothetical protein KFK09_012452 [Dendrobium nobile]